MSEAAYAPPIVDMQTFVSLETLSRRVNKCGATIRARLRDGTIKPDALVVLGGKQAFVFDAEKLPDIRKALAGHEVQL